MKQKIENMTALRKYRGVFSKDGKWEVRLKSNNKTICCGTFNKICDAIEVYDKKSTELWGESAITNKKLIEKGLLPFPTDNSLIINGKIENLTNELWKDVPEYEDLYQASNLGRIKSLDRVMWVEKRKRYLPLYSRLLIPSKDKNGYLRIVLCRDGKHKYIHTHTVIGLTFLPNLNKYPQINHINANILDNEVGNLEWCNCQQNHFHRWKIKGLIEKCNKEPIYDISLSELRSMKLNLENILKIRELYSTGKYTQEYIGNLFGVSGGCISNIVNFNSWNYLD